MVTLLLALIYLAFISLGLPDSLLGSAWPQMHLDLGAQLSMEGIISMLISCGTVISSLFSEKIIYKFGTGMVSAVSTLLTAVALFGFSTSSSAATLPLNTKTTVEELGVSEDIASFILPLGMTINMNGTAIMQVIAAIFIATSAGYDVTIGNIIVIGLLALIASIGTPAAPGAGAIILFTVLTGMGYNNDAAILAYSLILAINRPIEMLVTSLNVVGDAATSVVVAKSEGMLDEEVYNSENIMKVIEN